MSQQHQETNGNNVMRNALNAMAETMQPKDRETVRKFAEEKYPTCAERLQHLANLCLRHQGKLLPAPTESICPDCAAEREASKS